MSAAGTLCAAAAIVSRDLQLTTDTRSAFQRWTLAWPHVRQQEGCVKSTDSCAGHISRFPPPYLSASVPMELSTPSTETRLLRLACAAAADETAEEAEQRVVAEFLAANRSTHGAWARSA